MKMSKILAAAVVVLVGALLAMPASAAIVAPHGASAQNVLPQGPSLLVPVHRRSYRHCHRRRVCRWRRVRRCVRWRRGYCRRWVVRPIRRCYWRRWCHGGWRY
jgi:hypothetical protein